VSIGDTRYLRWNVGSQTWQGNDGIDASQGSATAANWDPFSSRELVVTPHGTTDPAQAAILRHS